MHVEIDYFTYASSDTPCGAQIEHQGTKIYGYGSTWHEAKQRVLANLQGKLSVTVPKRETVELPESEPENDEPPF